MTDPRFSSLQSVTTPLPLPRTLSEPLPSLRPEVGALGRHSVQVVEQSEPQLVGELLAPPPQDGPQLEVRQARLIATEPSARELASQSLPSRDALIERLGAPPKKDVTFLGLTLHHMSTGYKDVLAKLDAYHAAVAACRDRTPERDGSEVHVQGEDGGQRTHSGMKLMQIEDTLAVSEALEQLETSLNAYMAGPKHSHKAGMQQLLDQVRGEMAVVHGTIDAVDGLEGRPTVNLRDVFAFRRVQSDLSLDAIAGLQAKGYSASDYREIWAMTLEPHGLKAGDVHNALELGLPLATIRAYHEARLPITEQTQVSQCRDEHLSEPMSLLGKGGFNAVYRARYEGVDDGPPLEGVFKREIHGLQAGAAKVTGIDLDNPRWANRNVASHRLDARLGLGLTPPTDFALHEGRLGTVMGMARGQSPSTTGTIRIPLAPQQAAYLREHPEALQALVEERGFTSAMLDGDTLKVENKVQKMKVYEAPDDQGHEVGEPVLDENFNAIMETGDGESLVSFDFSDPVLRRDLTRLQWFDALTGQVDRHAHNYFVQRDGTGAVTGVTAIDNDCAFGAKLTEPDAVEESAFKALLERNGERAGMGNGLRGARLPEVIDRQTYDALMALQPEDLQDTLGGLLTPEEIRATEQRLAGIKAKLEPFEREGRVLDNVDDWGTEATTRLLGVQDIGAREAELREQGRLAGKSEDEINFAVQKLHMTLDMECARTSYVAREAITQDSARLGQQEGRFKLFDLPQPQPIQ